MDAKERAEKMLRKLSLCTDENGFTSRSGAIEFVAAQIEEAEREAYDRGKEYKLAYWHERIDIAKEVAYAEGFRAAREKAKGIAKEFCLNNCGNECEGDCVYYYIAQRIGEMEP